MPCKRMSFSRALKIAKEEYPIRSEDSQRKIAKGIQMRSVKTKKFKRIV